MAELGLNAPWVEKAREIRALFEGDDNVIVLFEDEPPKVTLYVDGEDKASSIERLLPASYTFGNVTMEVSVIPSNSEPTETEHLMRAFSGNPAFCGTLEDRLVDGSKVVYAMFAPKVVQFFADDISKAYGIHTKTYEQVASDVLECGAFICSELVEEPLADDWA